MTDAKTSYFTLTAPRERMQASFRPDRANLIATTRQNFYVDRPDGPRPR